MLVKSMMGVIFSISFFKVVLSDPFRQRLHRDVMLEYEKNSRPVPGNKGPVTVYFGATLVRIASLNEKDKVMKSHWWTTVKWFNSDLTWNASEYDDIDTIHIDSRSVWTPDVMLYNNANDMRIGTNKEKDFQTKVRLSSSGNQTWLKPAQLWSMCDIDVKFFPFDTQYCHLEFGSWVFSVDDLDLHFVMVGEVLTDKSYKENGEWMLVGTKVERVLNKYDCCKNPYSVVKITLTLNRRFNYYIMSLLLPCALIASMIFLSFVLPPEAGERISLSVTILMAMAVFQELTQQQFPPSKDKLPLMETYYTTAIFEIGVAICATCIIINFHHRKTKIPGWLLKIVDRIAPFVFMAHRTNSAEDKEKSAKEDEKLKAENCFRKICVSVTRKNKLEIDGNEITIKTEPLENVRLRHITPIEDGKRSRASSQSHAPETLENGATIQMVNSPYRFYDHENGNMEPNEILNREEWRYASKVLDRIFLVSAIVLGCVSFAAIFLQAPRIWEFFGVKTEV